MKTTITLLFSLCVFGLFGQQEVRITDPSLIRSDSEPLKDRSAQAGLQAAGLPDEQLDIIRTNSRREMWPFGLLNDSARAANTPYIKNYTAYHVFRFMDDTVSMITVMLPAAENIHMPEDLRPTADLFLVVQENGLSAVKPSKVRPEISAGPRWKDRPKAKIIDPTDLYATYDLGKDDAAMKALADAGLSTAEIDAVVFRSHERNWPDGIDSFDERYPRLNDFKRYKAFSAAKWDDKVLLIIPVEKNKKMSTAMRPVVDIYFIYNTKSVAVKAKKKRK